MGGALKRHLQHVLKNGTTVGHRSKTGGGPQLERHERLNRLETMTIAGRAVFFQARARPESQRVWPDSSGLWLSRPHDSV